MISSEGQIFGVCLSAMQLVLSTLSMEGCAKVAGILIAKKKEVNHADTENTEAKQKEGFHFRKKSFTQRRGDAKKRRKEEKKKKF